MLVCALSLHQPRVSLLASTLKLHLHQHASVCTHAQLLNCLHKHTHTTDFKGGNGRRRAAGAAAETRGRKARCDPVRWIEQPSKHWCACRGDPAAGPFDFSAEHAAHRAMRMRTRACTRMAAQMTRPALGSTPGRCLRQPRSSAAIAHSQPSRSTFRAVRACSSCSARAEHAHARACMHAHGSADDTASARQYAWPLPRSSAAPPSRPPGHPRPAALLLSRDTRKAVPSVEETMGCPV